METYTENNDQYLQAQRQVKRIKGFYVHLAVYMVVNLIIILSNAVIDKAGFATMDNYWTAIFWGIGLAAHGLNVFLPNFFFGTDWEKRKIKELMEKNNY